MDPSILLDKILQLEREIIQLKAEFPTKPRWKRNLLRTKSFADGVFSYWVPLALLIGLAVNWWFGVGFFENIRNIGINKTSSQYYSRIGEKLMSHAEFPAAADAFQKALQINSNNIDATHGLMKAQVLQAVGSSHALNPIVVEDKLTYLRDVFGKDDYILLYWEGILRRHLSENPGALESAKSLFSQSIAANPMFPGSHLELGNTHMLAGDIDEAIKKFQDVISIDRRFASALSNLGYCQFVLSNFDVDTKARDANLREAAKNLVMAGTASTVPEIDLRLGDTYLFMGQYRSARVAHENALELLERNAERTIGSSEIMFVYLPAAVSESHKRGPAIEITTPGELKALVLYSLSFDHAATKDFKAAQKYFDEASALDVRGKFSPLIAYCINALLRTPSISTTSSTWLVSHMTDICKGVEGCLPQTINSSIMGRKQP